MGLFHLFLLKRQMTDRQIVIVGAGFGGLQTAKSFAKQGIRSLLIDRSDSHVFIPLLYQVALGIIPSHVIAYPLASISLRYPPITFLEREIDFIDLDRGFVQTGTDRISYDYLVLATGSKTRAVPPGAFPLQTLKDAIQLREHLQQHQGPIVVVGGGTTGVEVAGALAEMGYAPVFLIQSRDYLLPDLPLALSRYTQRHLVKLGVQVRLGTRVTGITTNGVSLSNGEEIGGGMAIWTTGLEPNLPDRSGSIPLGQRGKVEVLPSLQLPNYDRVYVIGDLAAVYDRGEYLTGLAPAALQQGVTTARNILRQLAGKSPLPFRYFDKGRLAIIGGYGGVGKVGQLHLKGIIPWLLWLGVHWVYLPGWSNRWQVGVIWLKVYLWRNKIWQQNNHRSVGGQGI